MLALFVCWLAMFRASLALGCRFTHGVSDEKDRWFPSFWLGFLTLSSILLAVVCFTPLTPWVAAAVLLPPMLIWRQTPDPPRFFWLILAAMTYVSSSAERLYDTALYHRQTIDWMARDGLVPGLGIFHYRLGFSSSWFTWPALFDHGPLYGRMGSAATGLALATIVAHWIQRSQSCRSVADRFFLITAPLLCGYFLLESMIVSPSSNVGAACAAFVVLWMLLLPGASRAALLTAGAAGAVKISAAVLIPVCAWRARRVLAPALLLAVPLLIANWRTTGCPLFPAAAFCADSHSSVSAEQAKHVQVETQNWARYVGHYPADARFWSVSWFPRWISFRRKQVELGLALAGLLLIVIRRQWDACAAGAAAGLLYVFVAAPDFRFAAGFLLALPGRALAGFNFALPRIPLFAIVAAAVAMLTAGARTGEYFSNRWMPDERLAWRSERMLRPAKAWSPKTPDRAVRNGIAYATPGSGVDRCGAVPRPCAPAYAPLEEIMVCDASKGLRGGFCRPR